MLLPQEHTVMVRQTSKWGQIFLMSLVGVGATAFATAWFYRLDEVITVQGRLVPQSGGVEVKSPISGQLSQLNVESGEQIAKGRILVQFDVTSARERELTMSKQLRIEQKKLQDQLKSNTKRQETVKRNIELNKNILERLKPLEENGAITEVQILQKKNDIQGQEDELIQTQTRRQQLSNDSALRITNLKGELNQLQNQLKNEKIKAPISGTVFDLVPDDNNYVVTNAESLMKIVPKGKLRAAVNIGNNDIGFIKKGQEVKVRINSFPYTEYGEIIGKVNRIGADALPPNKLIPSYHFPVDLTLERSTLKTKEGIIIPLQAGMTITTNLKLRDRRLIELLSDIFSSRGESLKRLRKP